jgi:hypothetical protein
MLTGHRQHQIRSGQIVIAERAGAVRGRVKPVRRQCREHLGRRRRAIAEQAGGADRRRQAGRDEAPAQQRLGHHRTASVSGAEYQYFCHEIGGLSHLGLVLISMNRIVPERKDHYGK